jgi:hypothetical protein
MTLPKTSCEAERNCSKLSIIIIKKIWSSMLEERMNYLHILRVENYITKSLSCEEEIKEHAAKKKCRGKSVAEVCQAVS